MTVLEKARDEGERTKGEGGSSPSSQARRSSPKPSGGPSRFARYFTRTGWIHALLLLLVWLFFFPFMWMLFTSLKTDDELPKASMLPSIPTFRAASPYVREAVAPVRPVDVSPDQWEELLPKLTEVATGRIEAVQRTLPVMGTLAGIDEAAHRASAASVLVNQAVGKLHKELWKGPEGELFAEYRSFLDDDAVKGALTESLSSLDLLSFQLRTLDVHIYPMTTGEDFASTWKVESGPAKLLKGPDGSTLLSYDFPSSSSGPIVLRHDFELPANVRPEDLHKLILSIKADNSWHGVNAQLDLAGTRWTSTRTTYLAQNRPMSFLFQPPTFDDQMLRPKNWISLRADGTVPASRTATLRLIISPSNTLVAIWGKVIRNYLRAFDQVPFWHYIANSMILVALTTLGSIFSASFVAYAFARLNWPGRGVAFLLLLATMMLPPQVTMIPGFLIWRGLNWYNTLNPLWVPSFFGTAFFIFLMTQHMRTIPRDLEEAARLDGLNPVQSWYYIILPNVKPTLAAIAILSFMGSWNEFLQPLIYLRDQAKFPLALGIYGLKVDQFKVDAPDWTLIMAGDILMTLPVIAVFFLFQRYFVQGMTMTGMKG